VSEPTISTHDELDRVTSARLQPQRRTAVVCHSRRQFREWCSDNERIPNDPSLCLVLEIHHVQGRWFDEVVLVDGPVWLMEAAQSRLRADQHEGQQ